MGKAVPQDLGGGTEGGRDKNPRGLLCTYPGYNSGPMGAFRNCGALRMAVMRELGHLIIGIRSKQT